jgi:hypothetical protein
MYGCQWFDFGVEEWKVEFHYTVTIGRMGNGRSGQTGFGSACTLTSYKNKVTYMEWNSYKGLCLCLCLFWKSFPDLAGSHLISFETEVDIERGSSIIPPAPTSDNLDIFKLTGLENDYN